MPDAFQHCSQVFRLGSSLGSPILGLLNPIQNPHDHIDYQKIKAARQIPPRNTNGQGAIWNFCERYERRYSPRPRFHGLLVLIALFARDGSVQHGRANLRQLRCRLAGAESRRPRESVLEESRPKTLRAVLHRWPLQTSRCTVSPPGIALHGGSHGV